MSAERSLGDVGFPRRCPNAHQSLTSDSKFQVVCFLSLFRVLPAIIVSVGRGPLKMRDEKINECLSGLCRQRPELEGFRFYFFHTNMRGTMYIRVSESRTQAIFLWISGLVSRLVTRES